MHPKPDFAVARSESRRGFLSHLVASWTWRMAWRDTRTSRRKLALYSCSIVLGIAALAAIGSLGTNLEQAVEEQTKALLGADLVLHSQEAFTPEDERLFQNLGGEQSREVSLTTMAFFPRTENTRLVQVHALSGGFPFYGKLETEPTNAGTAFRQTAGGLIAEESLLTQFDARVGDSVRIGKLTANIAGRLEKVPGETLPRGSISPWTICREPACCSRAAWRASPFISSLGRTRMSPPWSNASGPSLKNCDCVRIPWRNASATSVARWKTCIIS